MKLKVKKLEKGFFGKRADMGVVWLSMAGVAINARGTVLLIDPLLVAYERDGAKFSETGHRFRIELPIEAKDVPRVDAVLYTHADPDHFGKPTAEILNERLKPEFLGPPPVAKGLREIGVDEKRITCVRDFQRLTIRGDVEVTVSPALHDYARSTYKRGDCCGYVVKTRDGTVWHPGDTRLIDDLKEVKGVDVMFFDVAAVEAHLGPEGSSKLAEWCGAKAMFAYHYGTYEMPKGSWGGCEPEDALPYVKGHKAKFLTPSPGEVLRLPLD